MRDPQASSGMTRRVNHNLPAGPAWSTLLQQVERELDAWIERRRGRSRTKVTRAPDPRPQVDERDVSRKT